MSESSDVRGRLHDYAAELRYFATRFPAAFVQDGESKEQYLARFAAMDRSNWPEQHRIYVERFVWLLGMTETEKAEYIERMQQETE